MQYDTELWGEEQDPGSRTPRQRPQSALETELNRALERLNHQVEDTKNYLASLDRQTDSTAARKRRKGDPKQSGNRSR
jgi:hypothetical protein